MVDHRANELVIVEGLKAYLTSDCRPCEIVRQNQVAKCSSYPYVSYTVTTPVVAYNGTYSQAQDGTLYQTMLQIWSFTVQSDDQDEALTLAMKAYDYFTAVGIVHLADNNITVRQVRNVTTRDNLLSIQYEFRNGLDVTFGLLYTIDPNEAVGVIETIEIKEE